MKKIYLSQAKICSLRGLDLKRLTEYFLKNNYTIVDNPKEAEIIVLSTCAYSNERANYSLNSVKKFLKYDAELIVIGCLPETEKEELAKIFDGKKISTKDLDRIDNLFPENKIKFLDIKDQNIPWSELQTYCISEFAGDSLGHKSSRELYHKIQNFILKFFLKNSPIPYYRDKFCLEKVYYLRLSRGCLGNCAYCSIKRAIGSLESKPMETIISEFESGLDQGYKNFVLIADDLGAYGLDTEKTFPDIVNELSQIPGKYKIELRNIHPVWVVKYVDEIEKILKIGKINAIFSSIQSGNERILKLMNRFSDVKKMRDTFFMLKNTYPDLLLGTDCIIGFPTETMEEYMDSLNFIKIAGFDMGSLLPFSSKNATLAEKIEPKIDNEEIRKRVNISKKLLKKWGYKVYYGDIFGRSNMLAFRKNQ